MDLKLKGKRALVTGSSNGIGRAIALCLADEGCVVAVHGRNAARVNDVVSEIRRNGGEAVCVCGDLTDDDSVKEVAASAAGALGGVDVLVANAGGRGRSGDGTWPDTFPEDFLETYQINVGSTVRLVHELVGGMKDRAWGRIILISSVAGIQPKPNSVPDYAASKAALINLGVSLSKWLSNTGVTVNTVSPGVIATDAIRGFMQRLATARGWTHDWESLERKAVDEVFKVPVGRIGKAEEVAALVALLASDLVGFMHGTNIRIDGGAVGVVN